MKKQRKIQVDWARRRLYLAAVDSAGVVLYSCFDCYRRALTWYGEGLSPRELAYAQQRTERLKKLADDMAALSRRLRKSVMNG